MRSQHRMPSTDADSCGKRCRSDSVKRSVRAGADVAIEIGEQILDEDLAAELLAEEADVGADDGPQIEEHGRLAAREARQELAERLGRKQRLGIRRRLTATADPIHGYEVRGGLADPRSVNANEG